jgi:hypothetical protein
VSVRQEDNNMSIRKIVALIPVAALAVACGGGEATPEAKAPDEAAAPAAEEAAPAADAPAAEGDAAAAPEGEKPAEGEAAKPAEEAK